MTTEPLLFNKWSYTDVDVAKDGLKRYINLTPVFLPHTSGRGAGKQFSKSQMNIVERLVNRMMRSGQGTRKVAGKYIRDGGNTGKKQKALKIVKDAFEIIEKRTKKNPIQVFIDAIVHTTPQEETTVIIYGGIRYHQAVDVAPQRRIDFALKHISLGAFSQAFKSKTPVAEALAEELMWAADGEQKSYAVQRKEETERIAQSAR